MPNSRYHKLFAPAGLLILWGILLLALLPSMGVSANKSAALPQSSPLTWLPSRTDGFGQNSVSVCALAEYGGQLYAGVIANSTNPTLIWTYDGLSAWSASSQPGFGGTNTAVRALAVYSDVLYAGTSNTNGAQVWSSTGSGWIHVADNGFGDPANTSVQALAVFKGRLYAGTSNTNGAQVWAYDGHSWSAVVTDALGDSNNIAVEALAIYGDKLYAGTRNANGAQVWSTLDGEHWSVIAQGGFGQASNVAVLDLASYHNQLYAAVENNSGEGGAIWRYDAISWQPSAQRGFEDANNVAIASLAVHNDALYAGTVNNTLGTQIWFTEGDGWWPSTKTGLGNSNNLASRALASYGDALWAGTENSTDGCAIWYGRPHLEFTVVSKPAVVAPPNAIRYETHITNTLGITLTDLVAIDLWECAGDCVYDAEGRSHIKWTIGDLGPGASVSRQFLLHTHSWCQPQVVTNTVRLQGNELAPMFTFATTVITQAATPTASPTFAPEGPLTVTLQQGLGGYLGTLDTHLYQSNPTHRYCNESLLYVGLKQRYAGLLRFDLSSISETSDIVRATLRLYAAGWWEGTNISLGAYVISRTVEVCQATWSESQAGEAWAIAGCNDVYTDRRPNPEATFTTSGVGRWYDLDVTEAVRAWVGGSLPNNGLLLRALSSNDEVLLFASSDYPEPTLRPMLVVTYFTGPPPTNTPTNTPTQTSTPTETLTPTATSTHTPTGTRSPTPTCPDTYEPNDNFGQAWDIGWGGHVESYICSAGDMDYYQASIGTLPFDGFTITLSNLPADYDLYVYDAARQLLASSTNPSLAVESVTVKGDSIYIKVAGSNGAYSTSLPYHLDIIPVTVPTETPTATVTPTHPATPFSWHVYLPVIIVEPVR